MRSERRPVMTLRHTSRDLRNLPARISWPEPVPHPDTMVLRRTAAVGRWRYLRVYLDTHTVATTQCTQQYDGIQHINSCTKTKRRDTQPTSGHSPDMANIRTLSGYGYIRLHLHTGYICTLSGHYPDTHTDDNVHRVHDARAQWPNSFPTKSAPVRVRGRPRGTPIEDIFRTPRALCRW